MNFEEAMRKVKAGTATPEERELVIAKLAQADAALCGKKPIDFDEALAHVQDGTATDEEREYVKAQFEEATSILNASPAETSGEEIADVQPSSEQEDSSIEFEEALEHVQKGTATEQEKLYVKSQTAAANALFNDNSRVRSAFIKEASGEDVRKAKKSFKKRYVFIPLCVLLAVIVALGAILGGVFGYAASSANKNIKYKEAQCKAIAIDYVLAHQSYDEVVFEKQDLWIDDCEKEFRYNSKNLGASSYYFEITVEGKKFEAMFEYELEVELRINTTTGNVIEVVKTEFDRDRR